MFDRCKPMAGVLVGVYMSMAPALAFADKIENSADAFRANKGLLQEPMRPTENTCRTVQLDKINGVRRTTLLEMNLDKVSQAESPVKKILGDYFDGSVKITVIEVNKLNGDEISGVFAYTVMITDGKSTHIYAEDVQRDQRQPGFLSITKSSPKGYEGFVLSNGKLKVRNKLHDEDAVSVNYYAGNQRFEDLRRLTDFYILKAASKNRLLQNCKISMKPVALRHG